MRSSLALRRTRGRAGEGGQQAVGQVHRLGRQRGVAAQVGGRRKAAQDADHRLEEADGGAALKVELVYHPVAAPAQVQWRAAQVRGVCQQ